MGSAWVLAISYAGFAAVATTINIGTQWLCSQIYRGPHALFLAMALGTIVGLVAKYGLDKRWIFRDPSSGLESHGRKFALYSLMGVGTTAIFWATEYSFDALSPDGRLRYLGAMIGLGIGYVTKYFADRRFVFGPAR